MKENIYNNILHKVQSLIKNKEEELNSINVFPIADKDTGSNFRKTLEIEDPQGGSFKEWFEDLVQKITYNAHGSSGNILALYLLGLKNNYCKDLHKMFTKASDYVWEVVYQPKEGTMLTIIKEAPNSSKEDFKEFLESYINKAIECLIKGPDLLPILKEKNTIDSGSLGLIYICCEVYKSLTNEDLFPYDITISKPLKLLEEKIEYRYCTEIRLSLTEINKKDLKEELRDKGDELIFIAFRDCVKFHVHTNNPLDIIEYCKQIGNVAFYKVEDMGDNNNLIEYYSATVCEE